MSYTHSKYQAVVATDASLTSASDVGDWAPGYVPHRIRAVALVVTTNVDDAGVLKVDKRPTAGSGTGRGDGDVAELSYASPDQGDVIYVDGLDVVINPGEDVVAEVTDATPTTGAAHIVYYVEPVWETPANNDAMIDGS